MHGRTAKTVAALVSLTLLAACKQETAETEAPPRPIKTFTVSEAAGTMARKFTGVTEAAETTALSFAVPGSILEVTAGVGTLVSQGDVIARLDPEPFHLEIAGARADVERASADLASKKGDLERNQVLYEKKWVSESAIEKYRASYEAAQSTLNYTQSRLALAERNLANAVLHAPYDGQVAARHVEAFEEIGAGQPVVEIQSTDGLAVTFAVPEVGLSDVALGQAVEVTFAALPGGTVTGRISEVEAAASAGNAYSVKASLTEPPATLHPGMTATITARADTALSTPGYFVPLAAIAPGETEFAGIVYRYDAEAGVVRRVPIAAEGVRDNLVIVTEGIEPGDVIAAAGVSFLMDGQAVRLLEE
jgi:RND family efflux transporter MFP subunit